jgi:peroxiredoxin
MLRVLAVAFLLAMGAQAPPDVQQMGPQVGERVPDFSLVDQNGATRTLRSVAGKNGTMLVFFRSADW